MSPQRMLCGVIYPHKPVRRTMKAGRDLTSRHLSSKRGLFVKIPCRPPAEGSLSARHLFRPGLTRSVSTHVYRIASGPGIKMANGIMTPESPARVPRNHRLNRVDHLNVLVRNRKKMDSRAKRRESEGQRSIPLTFTPSSPQPPTKPGPLWRSIDASHDQLNPLFT